jgi:hypothetical protein
MTGPDVPHKLRPPARAGTTAQRRVTGGSYDVSSPDHPAQWALAIHKPCPIHGCPGPAQSPMRSAAHPPAHEHSGPDHDTVRCQRCGSGRCIPAEV